MVITPCSEQAGPRVSLPSDPLGLFSLFLTTCLSTQSLRKQTYAEQTLQGSGKEWLTNSAEIRAYMGFMILMGINQLPEIRDYWSTNEYLHNAPIADRISRDRFEQITHYLHFTDNEMLPSRGEEGYSRLQKVDPVITHLKYRFQSVYHPHCQVSIDEAMIPFKGPLVNETVLAAETCEARLQGMGYCGHNKWLHIRFRCVHRSNRWKRNRTWREGCSEVVRLQQGTSSSFVF